MFTEEWDSLDWEVSFLAVHDCELSCKFDFCGIHVVSRWLCSVNWFFVICQGIRKVESPICKCLTGNLKTTAAMESQTSFGLCVCEIPVSCQMLRVYVRLSLYGA